MQKLLIVLVLLLTADSLLTAQSTNLPFPRNLEKAYEKGTRSWNGAPGPNYWQNRSSYNMRIALDPKKKRIDGSATIVYSNNSPDTLRLIRLKLAHDLYKKGGQRHTDVDPGDITDGVNIKRLEVEGKVVPKKAQRRHSTFLDIFLTQPLLPNSQIQLAVEWSFLMPLSKNAARECVCDPNTFFVPYFYPEVAVYDDLHGWDNTPYNGLQEFYHDFSDYDVTIETPKGYQVWATGEWQNAPDLLQPEYLARWEKARHSDEVVKIWSESEIKSGRVFKKSKKNEFHFKATEVPDFTFAASNHYNWDARSVVVDDANGRRTFVSAAYDSRSNDFKKVAQIAAEGLRLMSTWLPGYPFPYPCLTVFNGNDGMEYPMMINDASVSEDYVTNLTVHESAHTYFPFMMGINEQYYAWMDEGWANFFDHFVADSMQNKSSNMGGGWGFGNDWEVPPMVPSRYLSGQAYSFASYSRPQLAYAQLLDLLGYERFHRAMHLYMDRWKGKHPGPYDFFYTFNEAAGQNLDWFWKPWFFEFGYPDLKLTVARMDNVAGESPRHVAYVERKGIIPVPVYLKVEYTDGTVETKHKTAEVWRDPSRATLEFQLDVGKIPQKVTLGSKAVPDARPKDNIWISIK